jgi:hypothetical protein
MADLIKRELPPLELRTAYTQKGLGIGLGGFVGLLIGGPYAAIASGFVGWWVGNNIAIKAEKNYMSGQ